MIRNIVLVTGALAGALVLALGLAAAGFGPVLPAESQGDPIVVPPAAEAEPAASEAKTAPSEAKQTGASAIPPGASRERIVIVALDGSLQELEIVGAGVGIDSLMGLIETSLAQRMAGEAQVPPPASTGGTTRDRARDARQEAPRGGYDEYEEDDDDDDEYEDDDDD